ncbi:TonB-dependent receptor plug domain-containing protein, partial [Erythrobacter sp.]|uniref:TonB-dependent receptor plug domain-containing protein n=1 Tax=Erythrobacter sp. TaxID=1042 RepID=UPI00311FCE49
MPALAQPMETDETAAAAEPDPSGDIVVLGTRRTDRSVTDSASPVDVIGAEELATQPAGDMLDVMRNIVPSFNVGQNTIADASTFVRAPSIRGLPGDMTLVMINGKRLNRSALVQVAPSDTNALSQGADLAVLPSIAFGNLQILREGATAQYGSDAIAGVINYTLRDDEAIELTGRYGQYFDGGGDGISRQIAGYAGTNIGDRFFVGVAGEWNKDDGTIRNATRPSAVIFADTYPELADQLPNYPGPVQIYGSSPAKGWKGTFNAHFDITNDSQIYLFGNFAHERKVQSFNYRPPYTFAAETTTGELRNQTRTSSFGHPIYLTSCPAGNATCPEGGYVLDDNTFSFTDLYPAGFTPQFVGVKDQAYGVLGWKGNFTPDLTFNISASLAKNQLELSMFQSLNASYGPESQTEFYFGKLKSSTGTQTSPTRWKPGSPARSRSRSVPNIAAKPIPRQKVTSRATALAPIPRKTSTRWSRRGSMHTIPPYRCRRVPAV